MEALFLQILTMSFSASWLILAVILIRWLLRKAPKGFRYVLWALVAVRLLCPFYFESELSLVPEQGILSEVGDAVQPVAPITPNEDASTNDTITNDGAQNDIVQNNATQNDTSQNNTILNNATQDLAPSKTVTTPTDFIEVMVCLWIIGMILLFSYAVASYIKIGYTIRASVKREDNLWVCDGIQTPFILGLIRPQIYLPSYIEEGHVPYIVAHENEHIRFKDNWWKPFGFALLTVYWFNPLVWVAYILMCRDIEMACDERVIRTMGVEDKKNYSKSLLFCSIPRNFISACPVAFGEVGVKERIRKIVDYRKPSAWIITIAAVLCLIMAFGFMTNPKQDAQDVARIELGCASGRLVWVDITDADTIQQMIDGINDLSFVPISPNLPSGGWSYAIRMYDADDNLIDSMILLDDNKVEKEYFVYLSINGKFDTRYLDQLIAKAEFERLEDLQSELSSLQGMTEIQKDSLEWFNTHYFNNEENRITNAFLTSTYREAKNVDLYKLFCTGADGDITKQDMETVLQRYLGMSLEETNKVNWNKIKALEEDSHYNIPSDTVMPKYYFTRGWKEEKTGNIILEYFDVLNGDQTERYWVTLKLVNGNYCFVSNESVSEKEQTEGTQENEDATVNLISDELMSWFNREYFNESPYGHGFVGNQFLTSEYASPKDIDLYELFYNGAYIVGNESEVSEEEKQLLLERYLDEIHSPIFRIATWEMNEFLQKYMGITLEETHKYGLDKMYYLEEYDAYYLMHADSNVRYAIFHGGKINDDGTITLMYTPSMESGSYYWVTLKEQEGKYYIISNILVESARQ